MAEDIGERRGTKNTNPADYEHPRIVWEEELPQGPNLFSACGKLQGQGGACGAAPAS